MNPIKINQPFKLSAFKHLMAHVSATAISVAPAPLLYGSIIGMVHFANQNSWLYNSLGVSAIALGLLQAGLMWAKVSGEPNPLNASFWKQNHLIAEEKSQKECFEQSLLSIRHLTSHNANYQPSVKDYETIASLLVSKGLDDLPLTLWANKVVEKNYEYRWNRDIKQSLGATELYTYVEKIAAKMDTQRLEAAENQILESQKNTLKNEDVFAHFCVLNGQESSTSHTEMTSGDTNIYLATALNDAVYRRASYLLDHQIIERFTEKNYDAFSRIISQSDSVKSIDELINFLHKHSKNVDWAKMVTIFNENFKGKIEHYERIMPRLQQRINLYQKDYEAMTLRLQAQNEAQSVFNSVQNSHPLDEKKSLDHTLSSTQSSTPTPHQNTLATEAFKPCGFVFHSPHLYKDKWEALQNHYQKVTENHTQIDKQLLANLNDSLNVCLPLLITTDINLSKFPHLNTELNRKLIEESLDLAISQTQEAVHSIGQDIHKELRASKNYQTMKMSKN